MGVEQMVGSGLGFNELGPANFLSEILDDPGQRVVYIKPRSWFNNPNERLPKSMSRKDRKKEKADRRAWVAEYLL